ncbi:MAG: energy-coupling factor ABC transporter permease [Verrucomicrobiota bacterium]
MHIPDGFLDGRTAAVTGVVAAGGVGLALRQVRRELPPRRIPLLGLAAAFLFAAQMVNFPVLGGTSGHLVGGVLVAALLGPGAAIVVLTTVLIVQCFLFNDGGLLALGANILNMGIIGAGAGYAIYRAVAAVLPGTRGRVTAVAFAGWCSTVLAAMACAGELAASGTVAWSSAFTAMTVTHMLIGVGEGLIGALVYLAVLRTRPELAETGANGGTGASRGWRDMLRYGLPAALGIALFVAPFACPWPDGLEKAAERLGFAHREAAPALASPAANYQFPGIHWAPGATALAGASGCLVVLALSWMLGRWLAPEPRDYPQKQ